MGPVTIPALQAHHCYSLLHLGSVLFSQIYGVLLSLLLGYLCGINRCYRIIVGVKYCFRYNQRNRQIRGEESGEPIDLLAMPRTHRRRREKKLMSMDEVNERFPLVKYKAWRSSRADEGLSTAGGIAASIVGDHNLDDGHGRFTASFDALAAPTPQLNDNLQLESAVSRTKEQIPRIEVPLDKAEKGSSGFVGTQTHVRESTKPRKILLLADRPPSPRTMTMTTSEIKYVRLFPPNFWRILVTPVPYVLILLRTMMTYVGSPVAMHFMPHVSTLG